MSDASTESEIRVATPPPWWPWPDFDPATRILPWAGTVVQRPSGVLIRVEHAAVTDEALIVLLETSDGSEDSGQPIVQRGTDDFRVFISLPGGARLQSVGEWEVEQSEAEINPDSRGYSLRDYGITDARAGGGVVVLRPRPDPGDIELSFSWGRCGVSLVAATFQLPEAP